MPEPAEIVRGTLDLLILRAVSWGPVHGYAVARWIAEATSATLSIEEGTLYPALHRLHERGLIDAEWGLSENNRRARYYTLTTAGRRHLRFHGPKVDADVDDELRFHLESLEADLRAQGFTEADARREAARRFGNVARVRERLRRQDTRHSHRAVRTAWWRDLMQDVRYTLRSLAQHRA